MVGGGCGSGPNEVSTDKTMAAQVRPQTIREQLEARIQYHELEIQKHKEALEALSPDVERALNALARLGY